MGKTTLINLFAEQFDTYMYLNLEEKENRLLFTAAATFEDLVAGIYAKTGNRRGNHRTLLFIDEIQNCPEAIQSLRYFYERCNEVHVVAAGSLLESIVERYVSFPVGRVEYMALHPCTFGEFLNAIGEEEVAAMVSKAQMPSSLHEYTMTLFRKYMVVGGLPEAVADYAKHRDYVRLEGIFNTLLAGYKDDVEKYSPHTKQQDIIRYILNYGWPLAGQRFQFAKFGGAAYRSSDMADAFRMLEKTLLLELVYPLTSTTLPILPDLRKSPKLLWLDTGLVNYVAGVRDEILFSTNTDDLFNGTIAEQAVAQQLLALSKNFGQKRMFWVRDAKNSQAEVDFIYRHGTNLIPIEVKTGANAKLRSLHLFMQNSPSTIAIRLWPEPPCKDTITLPSGKTYILHNLPLYYSAAIPQYLNQL